jgi:AcrR family transcriptional regulator
MQLSPLGNSGQALKCSSAERAPIKSIGTRMTIDFDTMRREPQQDRSRASMDRIMAASQFLVLKRGDDEFTLNDVAAHADVSVGSIYLRFESKTNLVRATVSYCLDDVGLQEESLLSRILAERSSLSQFVQRYVDGYAELLQKNACILRMVMSSQDPRISAWGHKLTARSATLFADAMLQFAAEFHGSSPVTKLSSAYHIMFASLTRQLSLGSTRESAQNLDWQAFKRELGRMCIAYLRSDDR